MLKNVFKPLIFILNTVSYLIFCLIFLFILIWISIITIFDRVRNKPLTLTEAYTTVIKIIRLGFYNTFAYGIITTNHDLPLKESFYVYRDVFNFPYRTYFLLNKSEYIHQKLIASSHEGFKTTWERNTLKRIFLTG